MQIVANRSTTVSNMAIGVLDRLKYDVPCSPSFELAPNHAPCNESVYIGLILWLFGSGLILRVLTLVALMLVDRDKRV